MKNKILCVKQLSIDGFYPYGFYSDLLDPSGESIGKDPVIFFRDLLQIYTGQQLPSLSSVRTHPRKMMITESEYHSFCSEVTMPLDGDILIHVAPASPADIPFDKIEVFRVPKGTAVVLRPGVWHGAPFPIEDKTVNSLVILPERAYANDCCVTPFSEENYLEIRFLSDQEKAKPQ